MFTELKHLFLHWLGKAFIKQHMKIPIIPNPIAPCLYKKYVIAPCFYEKYVIAKCVYKKYVFAPIFTKNM